MTFAAFTVLSLPDQLAAVFQHGHFLATRWQAEDEAVNLYELPGRFFVELTYDAAANYITDILAFGRDDHDRLADYAVSVRLPDGLSEGM